MSELDNAIQRIKRLECPVGDMESRVAGILADYGVSKQGQAAVTREEDLDREGIRAYGARIPGRKQDLVILAESGSEDYVARVVEAYLH